MGLRYDCINYNLVSVGNVSTGSPTSAFAYKGINFWKKKISAEIVIMFCVFSTFLAAAIIYQYLLFGSPVPLSRAFHKLLGNFLATSRISSNFFNSEQLL